MSSRKEPQRTKCKRTNVGWGPRKLSQQLFSFDNKRLWTTDRKPVKYSCIEDVLNNFPIISQIHIKTFFFKLKKIISASGDGPKIPTSPTYDRHISFTAFCTCTSRSKLQVMFFEFAGGFRLVRKKVPGDDRSRWLFYMSHCPEGKLEPGICGGCIIFWLFHGWVFSRFFPVSLW